MDAAASSIKRDGIGYTSKLEQTLFDDMNGLCRELMAELVGLHYGSIRDFTKSESHVKEDSRGRARLVCIMADGTGIPMRKECLQGAKALLPLRTLYKSDRLEEFFNHLVKDLPQVDCAA